MSVNVYVELESGRRFQEFLLGSDLEGDPWDFTRTLARAYDTAEVAAEGAGVDLGRFFYTDPQGFEDDLKYLQLSEEQIAERRSKLAAQAKWHPIAEGLAAFRAVRTYLKEHPDLIEHPWKKPLMGALRTVIAGMKAAIERGESGFHLDGG
jgi:hypothetical protein